MTFKTPAFLLTGALTLWLLHSGSDAAPSRPRAASPEIPPTETPVETPSAEPGGTDAPEAEPLVGVVAAPETLELVAAVAGRVSAVRAAAGDRVRRGARLVEIAPDDLDLRRQAQEARVRESGVAIRRARLAVDLRRRRAERRKTHPDLFSLEDREEAQLELESALLELEAAMARQAEAEAELRLLRQRIARGRVVAPIDALVSERLVDPGGTVSPGQPLLRLVDAAARIVRFAVPTELHRRFAVGMAVGIRLENSASEVCATIARVSPKVEESAPLLVLEADLPAGDLAGVPLGVAVRVRTLEEAACGET